MFVCHFFGCIAVLGIALWSCKKDEPKSIDNINNTDIMASQQLPFASIQASINGKSFDLKIIDALDEYLDGDFLGNHFNQLTFKSEYQNEVSSMSKIDDYSYTSSTNSRLQQLSFSNFNEVSDNEFTVDVTVNNSTVSVTITNNGFSMLDFQEDANSLTSNAEFGFLAYFAIVATVAAVTWVADASLEYCQTVITQGTQNCSANKLCADIGWCSVTCYSCPK